MSVAMSRFLCFVALLLVSQCFSRNVEALSSVARDRVILAYTTASDRCKDITADSHTATKVATDSACDEAFKALDAIGKNSCENWKFAECRLLDGAKHSQCTCIISSRGRFDIKVDETKTFRQCALEIWTDAYFYGEPRLSERFQEAWRIADIALKTSGSLPPLLSFRSPSNEVVTYFGAGSSNAVRSITISDVSTGEKQQDPKCYCHPCKKYYSTRGNLRAHIRSQHPESELAVKIIPRISTGENKEHPEDSYCRRCKQHFANRGNLVKHYKRRHRGIEPDPPTKGERGGSKDYVCEICGESYSLENSLNEHRKKHTQNLRCPFCSKELGTKGNLKRHISHNHPEDETGPSEYNDSSVGSKRKRSNDPFCFICERFFANKANLERHIETAHRGEERGELIVTPI